VDENRYDYVTAPRHSKVEIASRVIASVHKSGGRFLGLNPRTKKWEEVPIRRATEKACQALREDATAKVQVVIQKRKRSDPRGQASNKRKRLAKKPSAPVKKTTQTKPTLSSSKNTPKTRSSTKPSGKPSSRASGKASTKESGSQAEAPSQLKKKKSKKKKKRKKSKEKKFLTEEQIAQGAALHDGVELAQLSTEGDAGIPYVVSPYAMYEETFEDDPNARPFLWLDTKTEAEWEKLYQGLERFRKILGHAVVPPNWAGDVELADWSCRQRHLYREVVATSHRKASDVEQMRIQKLEDVGFVWDYDKWRSHRRDKDIERRLDNSEVKSNSRAAATPESNTLGLEETKETGALGKLSDSEATKIQIVTVNIVHEEETDDEDFLLI
jgi:hypothetical protein